MTYPDSTTPTYTEADVAELVRVAKRAVPYLEAMHSNVTAADLADALKPFRPDPEAELIEAMAIAMWQERNPFEIAWEQCPIRDMYRAEARAALNVLKERDLLKTPRKACAL